MHHRRLKERALLSRKLEAGINIHMPAPRRIGKTWTINRLASDLRQNGWHTVELDVEGLSTPREFARALCKRIGEQNSIRERFESHFRQYVEKMFGGEWGDRPLEIVGTIDPIESAEALIASLNETVEKAAIIVDEIAYFFLALAETNHREAKSFAYQLRAIQQRYKNVRWVLTGSIGLDTIAKRYGLTGAFVDFEVFVLQPFSPEAARSFLRDATIQQQLNHEFDASDADFDKMFAELGWLAPYYLLMIANEVRPSGEAVGGKPATATWDDFDAAFEKLLQPNRQSGFGVWREHVEKNLPQEDSGIAKYLLDFLSINVEGEIKDTLLAKAEEFRRGVEKRQVLDVLAMLSSDGLISYADGRYRFVSGLVRRYWNTYEAM